MKRAIGGTVLSALMIAAASVDAARAEDVGADPAASGSTVEACINAAGAAHRVPAGLLVLLMTVEDGRLGAVTPNTNGTVDIGPMQINNTWVGKIASHWRATPQAAYAALKDSFCANVEGGAWILRQALDEAHGNLWEGVALYHSHTPAEKVAYLRSVYAHAMRLKRQAERELMGAPIAIAESGR